MLEKTDLIFGISTLELALRASLSHKTTVDTTDIRLPEHYFHLKSIQPHRNKYRTFALLPWQINRAQQLIDIL